MKQKIFFNIQYILLVLIALTIPVHNFFFPKLFVFLIAAWFFEFDFKTKFKRMKENRLLIPFIVFALFYILYIVGMTYSSNIDFGITDLILKAPILFAPLIVFSMDLKKWDFKRRKILFLSFITGCFIILIINLVHSIYLYHQGLGFQSFLYSTTSWWFHPSYLAMFYCMAVSILIYFLVKFPKTPVYQKIIAYFVSSLFVVDIAFLSSKSGYLSIVFALLSFIAFSFFAKKIKRQTFIYATSLLLIFIITYLAVIPKEYNRMMIAMETIEAISHTTEDKNSEETNIAPTTNELQNENLVEKEKVTDGSTFARFHVWKNAWSLAIETLPFGTGTGDVRDDLIKKHTENPITKDYPYNAHCQFLQVFATLGILGILSFLACFVLPLWMVWRKKYFLYFVFLFVIIINFLVESMLETQAGVSFYAIFNSILLIFTMIYFNENQFQLKQK